jgi:hypothetical protein
MRCLFASILACLAFASAAHAQPGGVDAPAGTPATGIATKVAATTRLAIAVNSPFGWLAESMSFGASVYLGFAKNHVIRANVAIYPYGDLFAFESSFDGLTTDLGASYMYFPRRAFDGFVVEAGFVHRNEDGVEHGPFSDDTTEKTQLYGGRAMIGWSWMLGHHFFTSVQAGASVGYERGTESACSSFCMDEGDKPHVKRIADRTVSPEAMIRIGASFDL